MFLNLLNESEGQAFMELASQAMQVNGVIKDCELAVYNDYLAELGLADYTIENISFEKAASAFKHSSMPAKRVVIIELCGILYSDDEFDSNEQKWIYRLTDIFKINKAEADKLIQWSKDFSDFLEVGFLYINAKA